MRLTVFQSRRILGMCHSLVLCSPIRCQIAERICQHHGILGSLLPGRNTTHRRHLRHRKSLVDSHEPHNQSRQRTRHPSCHLSHWFQSWFCLRWCGASSGPLRSVLGFAVTRLVFLGFDHRAITAARACSAVLAFAAPRPAFPPLLENCLWFTRASLCSEPRGLSRWRDIPRCSACRGRGAWSGRIRRRR